MSTIITIAAGDLPTNSRADLNTNFSNLNSDKIETSTLDTDTALTANSDSKVATQKATKAYVDAGGNVNASETSKGIVEQATQAEVDAGTADGATGARLFVNPSTLPASLSTRFKFGGSGADGALTITSGTTTVDLGSSAVVVKNYTSISITGTGVLGFSNPHANGTVIILKSQGAVTITSSATRAIDARGMGATGGTSNGGSGTAMGHQLFQTATGGSGVSGENPGGAGGTAMSNITFYLNSADKLHRKLISLLPGAGGGGGGTSSGNGAGGVGGTGGGALLIECAGALNFTGTIDSSGNAGSNGSSGTDDGGGGGGGGSAGMVVILYNTLTANSGTITCYGGNGGNGGSASGAGAGNGGGGGGGGACLDTAGATGGSSESGGINGTLGGGSGGAGGAGNLPAGTGGTSASGITAIVAQNKDFA